MKCALCKQEMYDKFENSYIVSYCSTCKLNHCQLNIFKNLIITTILNKRYKKDIYDYMIFYFTNNFCKYKFGIINKTFPCKLLEICQGAIRDCRVYQYNYNNFKFYYCFYNDLIIFNKDDIEILINVLYKISKKHKIYMFFNNIKKWLKGLIIKEEKIEGIENVKK